MNDLEVCKKVAEIEGVPHTHFKTTPQGHRVLQRYDPLADDALCFKLMVKHKVNVDFTVDGYVRVWENGQVSELAVLVEVEKANYAICIAILRGQL